MTVSLDVHIIINPSTPQEWVDVCIKSIHVAIDNAGYPVSLHKIDFIPNHIGKSRSIGYKMGEFKYVTSVDDDDWLEPNAFSCLKTALNLTPPAIYTHAWTWQNNKKCASTLRQQLRVFRRDVVESFDLNEWAALDSTALITHADTFGSAIEIPEKIYNYRLRLDSGAKTILSNDINLVNKGFKFGNVHLSRNIT